MAVGLDHIPRPVFYGQVDQEMREQLIVLRAENQQLGNELKRQARAALTSAAVQAPSGASLQAQVSF